MSELRQSPDERKRLDEEWQSHPNVVELKARAHAFAEAQALRWDAAGVTAVLKLAADYIKECGDWPRSGIIIG